MNKELTKEQLLRIELIKKQAEKDVLCADFILKCKQLDNEIEDIKNGLDNIEAYGDMT